MEILLLFYTVYSFTYFTTFSAVANVRMFIVRPTYLADRTQGEAKCDSWSHPTFL